MVLRGIADLGTGWSYSIKLFLHLIYKCLYTQNEPHNEKLLAR